MSPIEDMPPKEFNVYDDIKKKLMVMGVPEDEIAFIHDYDTPEQKQALFNQMNAGEVRVLLGSTAKCGAGMNAQQKMIALHHLDAPMRPSDVERLSRNIKKAVIYQTKQRPFSRFSITFENGRIILYILIFFLL